MHVGYPVRDSNCWSDGRQLPGYSHLLYLHIRYIFFFTQDNNDANSPESNNEGMCMETGKEKPMT